MKPLDDQLDRLLRAAAQAPREAALSELPFTAQARVMGAWRSSHSDSVSWLANWLRAGLAAAALVAALAWGLSWPTLRAPNGDEYAVANAALYVAIAP